MLWKSQEPAVQVPKHGGLQTAISESFDQWGATLAMVDGATGKGYRYSELNDVISRIAGNLHHAARLRKGDVVCVYAPNSVEYALIMMAVPSIGGIITACNPVNTPEEVLRQFRDCQATYLVTTTSLQRHIPELLRKWPNIRQVYIIGDEVEQQQPYLSFGELLKPGPAAPHVPIDTREDIALLLYSSGTTGLPKGTMITHYNVIAAVLILRQIKIAYEDTFIAVFPMFHIAGAIHSLYSALYNGCTIIFYPQFDFETFLAATEKYKATVMAVPPPVIVGLAKDLRVDTYNLSLVRQIVTGAAPVSKEIIEEVQQRLPSVRNFIQGYGATENTGSCTMTRPGDVKLGSAGPVLPNVEFKVIDIKTGEELPAGKDGEILMRGPTVMKGYLNNPAATAEIIKNGWLYTGDIGHADESGHLYIVDRRKELIKYKGYQVAPAELEALLLTHPDVADAAVIGEPDLQTGELPRAFIVLKAGRNTIEEDIKGFVKKHAAPYKQLRGGVSFVTEIPKSPSGKILRRILKDKLNATRTAKSKL